MNESECDRLFRWVAELFARQDECYRELARVKGELAGQSQAAYERGEEIARLRLAAKYCQCGCLAGKGK